MKFPSKILATHVALSIFQIWKSDCCQWLIQLQSLCHKAQSVAIHSKGAAREVQMRHLKLRSDSQISTTEWWNFLRNLMVNFWNVCLKQKHFWRSYWGSRKNNKKNTRSFTCSSCISKWRANATIGYNRCKSPALAVINMRKYVWNLKALESLEGPLSGAFPRGCVFVRPSCISMFKFHAWQDFAEMLWFSRNKPRLLQSFNV